ncbi:MAG: metal-dependent phosphohydrolase [Thermodesulfovibrio sp.]|nr:metal-dependent phosphohydrolase [Thermodesulfovibrio sp.]
MTPFKLDLHVHTRHSGDNSADPEEAVVQAIGRNLQGIAFTEHYYYEASEFAEQLCLKYRDRIVIFRGVEFSTADGHCLVFGVNTDGMGLKGLSAGEVVRAVVRAGGVVIPSHPYRLGNSLGDGIRQVKGICAVEGYNGCNMASYNVRAIEAARALGLPFTGGSDAHEPADVGACYTEFDAPVTPENLVEQLRGGRYRGVDTRKISKGYPG